MTRPALVALALAAGAAASAQPALTVASLDPAFQAVESKVVEWRRDFHQHPELSNRETRTAGVVAAHLESLGLEVETGVAVTGVVGVLRGGRPGAGSTAAPTAPAHGPGSTLAAAKAVPRWPSSPGPSRKRVRAWSA